MDAAIDHAFRISTRFQAAGEGRWIIRARLEVRNLDSRSVSRARSALRAEIARAHELAVCSGARLVLLELDLPPGFPPLPVPGVVAVS